MWLSLSLCWSLRLFGGLTGRNGDYYGLLRLRTLRYMIQREAFNTAAVFTGDYIGVVSLVLQCIYPVEITITNHEAALDFEAKECLVQPVSISEYRVLY